MGGPRRLMRETHQPMVSFGVRMFRLIRLIILLIVAFVAGMIHERNNGRDLCNQTGGQWMRAGFCALR